MDNYELILDYVNKDTYLPKTLIDLYNDIDLEIEYEEYQKIINDLINNNDIFLNKKKDRILSSKQANIYKGTIIIKNHDFGFVTNPYYPDFYVSKEDMLDAMNQDYCLYKVTEDYGFGRGRQATLLKILKRKCEYLVGEVRFFRGKYYLYNESITKDIIISNCNGAKVKDIVRSKIINYGYTLKVEVTDILGDTNSVGIEITKLLYEANVPIEFSEEVINYTNNIDFDYQEIKKRKRFDNELIFTIDGESAKDLDDAVSIRKEKDLYKLNVYIADVSYYVKEDSILDNEAMNRGTSIYLLDRVVPMLPVRLSNDLCSLNPNEEKLVISLEMTINNKGDVIDRILSSSVIKTTKRLSYEKCNDVLTNGISNNPDYQVCYDSLLLMVELKNILKEKRYRRGSIDFDIDEVKIILDEDGKVFDVKKIERGESECIIEEFMIVSNETVAEMINEMSLPFIYRVHDKPDNIKFNELKTIVKGLGYHLGGAYSKEIQKLLEHIDNNNNYLKDTILRLMAKAIYSTNNIGHFGLASSCYTHFTSPIRRYPDLIVHRLIRKYLFNNDNVLSFDDAIVLENKLANIASISSEKEKVSNELEFKVNDMKLAEYMEKFIGTIYFGTIVSIHKFGIFVSIGNTIEGLINNRNLNDNYYVYNSDSGIYHNKITKDNLLVGKEVKVKLIKANRKNGEIDFNLVYNIYKGANYGKSKSHRKK